MKLKIPFIAFLACAPLPASAVTITINAEVLKDETGTTALTSGLVVLTTATNLVFTGPSANSFGSSGEEVVAMWEIDSISGGFGAGTFSVFLDIGLAAVPGWDTGDPLRMYWYPSLTAADTPQNGDFYGMYDGGPGGAGADGSAAWTTLSDSDTLDLRFFTAAATQLNSGGTYAEEAGEADRKVQSPGAALPDASSTLFLMSLSLAGLATVRRLQQSSKNA